MDPVLLILTLFILFGAASFYWSKSKTYKPAYSKLIMILFVAFVTINSVVNGSVTYELIGISFVFIFYLVSDIKDTNTAQYATDQQLSESK